MDLETAEKELAIRLYLWGQKDFAREQREGYPLLTPIRDDALQTRLYYIRSLFPDASAQFVLACQKLTHPLAVALLKEKVPANAKILFDTFRMAVNQIQLEMHPGPAATTEVTKVFAVKRSLAAKVLLPMLTGAFGFKPKKFDSLQWIYSEQFGDWCFSTELDLGGTWGTEIRYWFRLKRDDDKPRGLMPVRYSVDDRLIPYCQDFSLHSLYGLGSQPKYAVADEEQVPSAAQSLIDIHAHIVRFVPEWLDGLSVGS